MNPHCKISRRSTHDRVVADTAPFAKNRNRAPTKVKGKVMVGLTWYEVGSPWAISAQMDWQTR